MGEKLLARRYRNQFLFTLLAENPRIALGILMFFIKSILYEHNKIV